MNEAMRDQAAQLRKMPSSEAADWLLRNHPTGGDGMSMYRSAEMTLKNLLDSIFSVPLQLAGARIKYSPNVLVSQP